ncbi:MAG TPA: CAAX prenyl protease-related protein [Candidatus Binatia bacterium]|jgi:CAAX prenyl protease-like protein|nr:CAAX prenyl protease-related protein [Candidatus Binatia bacterium]
MTLLREKLERSAIHARVVPYVLILVLTLIQDNFSGPARFWFYLAKMVVGLWCIWEMRLLVPEMRWALSWEAVAVGVLVFIIWVGLDPYYPKFDFLVKGGEPWNPYKQFGQGSALGVFFVAVRTLGSAIVVPPIEEAFYRSFLYRYFVRLDFPSMPFNRLHWLSLIVTSLLFGFAHYQWLPGFLCGLAFQWLVIRKNRLGDAMTAHAITNFLLGLYVACQGKWNFW